jgi:hypothetical protein
VAQVGSATVAQVAQAAQAVPELPVPLTPTLLPTQTTSNLAPTPMAAHKLLLVAFAITDLTLADVNAAPKARAITLA